jgi:hypothetical protein
MGEQAKAEDSEPILNTCTVNVHGDPDEDGVVVLVFSVETSQIELASRDAIRITQLMLVYAGYYDGPHQRKKPDENLQMVRTAREADRG